MIILEKKIRIKFKENKIVKRKFIKNFKDVYYLGKKGNDEKICFIGKKNIYNLKKIENNIKLRRGEIGKKNKKNGKSIKIRKILLPVNTTIYFKKEKRKIRYKKKLIFNGNIKNCHIKIRMNFISEIIIIISYYYFQIIKQIIKYIHCNKKRITKIKRSILRKKIAFKSKILIINSNLKIKKLIRKLIKLIKKYKKIKYCVIFKGIEKYKNKEMFYKKIKLFYKKIKFFFFYKNKKNIFLIKKHI